MPACEAPSEGGVACKFVASEPAVAVAAGMRLGKFAPCGPWWRVGVIVVALAACGVVDSAWGRDVPLLVTQVPLAQRGGADSSGETIDPGGTADLLSQGRGGRLVLVAPDDAQRVLTTGFFSAADPTVSFDGKRVLFAGQRAAEDLWNIYELNLAELSVRQVTRDCGNCRQPGYQATLYTIVSTEPWYQLTFVSDMAGEMNERGTGVARSLYSCKLDGSAVRRLTYNLSDDVDPFMMLDGRLLFTSFQRSTLERGIWGRAALFGVNIDGADYALFGDVSGGRFKRMPCVTDRGVVLFVEGDRLEPDGAGQLGAVTFRRPLKSYRPITKVSDGYVYRYPAAWPDGRVLVSRRRLGGPQGYEIVLLEPKTGAVEAVFDDPQRDDIQAIAVRPTPEPDGRSSVVTEEDPHGKLYCLNVAIDDSGTPHTDGPEPVRRVRFLEGVPPAASDQADYLAGRNGASVHGLPPLVQRRILGEVDISPDGSFHVEIPASIPLQIQTVDEHGVALRTCGWIWSKNHEPRGCIGCHEDGELTPKNHLTESLQRSAIALTLPPERRRTVDFRRDIMPIIDRKCVACHDAQGDAPRLDGGLTLQSEPDGSAHFNRAYTNLLETVPTVGRDTFVGKYVEPGKARTSPLIWHLFGKNLARSWDGEQARREAVRIPAGRVEPLTDLEQRAFVEWVDLGAMWDGIPGPNGVSGSQ